jgi:hypothetical protein
VKWREYMTIRELADKIGVSPATISIVINGKKGVGEDTRERVLRALKENNYNPGNRKKNNDKNVLLVKYTKSGFFVEENQGFISMIIDSIEEQLRSRKRGITMMIIKNDLLLGLNEIDYEKYSGMILIGTEMIDDDYNCLKDIPIPFVVVDNAVPNIMCSSISINNYENVYIAISYLKEAGHNRIGYIGSKSETENFRERRTAFELTVKKLNIEFDEDNDYKVTPTLIGSHDDFLEILEKKDLNNTVFFAENDTIALGVIKALKEKRYKIPADVSIIGFDDIAYSSVSSPTLTTVHVQRKGLGKQTVLQLLQLIEENKLLPIKTRITGRLVQRDSVKTILL